MECVLCHAKADGGYTAPCGHAFHPKCISSHVARVCDTEFKSRSTLTCPTCDAELLSAEEEGVKDVREEDYHTCCRGMFMPPGCEDDYDAARWSRMCDLRNLFEDLLDPQRVVTRAYFARKEQAKRALVAELDRATPQRVEDRRQHMLAMSYNYMRIIGGLGGLSYNRGPSTDEVAGDYYDDLGGGHFTYTKDERWVRVD